MKCIEAMDLVLYAISIVRPEERYQMRKDKINELSTTVVAIKNYLAECKVPEFDLAIESLLGALMTAENLKVDMLPDNIRIILGNALLKLKYTVADICFKYYADNTFEDTEEHIEIMREVVRCEVGNLKDYIKG